MKSEKLNNKDRILPLHFILQLLRINSQRVRYSRENKAHCFAQIKWPLIISAISFRRFNLESKTVKNNNFIFYYPP